MSNKIFIAKENSDLPDFYGFTVIYLNGKSEDFQVASHCITRSLLAQFSPVDQDGKLVRQLTGWNEQSDGILEFVTHEDKWCWIPLANIQRLEFDKNFSKIIAIHEQSK